MRIQLLDIAVAGYIRPVLRQHLETVVVQLDLPLALHAGAFESEVYPADAGEKTAEGERYSSTSC